MAGQVTDAINHARTNSTLAPLPEDELRSLLEAGELVHVEMRELVYQRGKPIKQVHFPLTAVFSMVALVDDDKVVEVATIGNEGLVGLPLFLGASKTPNDAFCQVSGASLRLRSEDLRQHLAISGTLRQQLYRFTQATMIQLSQNVACNQVHSVRQRAARWLLMTQDRVRGDTFQLTQQFLAQMLGVRRPTVSETASNLQSAGLINYSRGLITITDRAGLEKASCTCYQIVRAEFDHLRAL